MSQDTLIKSATAGDRNAQMELALHFLCGPPDQRDWPTGIRWMERAAAGDLPQAKNFLLGLAELASSHFPGSCSCHRLPP